MAAKRLHDDSDRDPDHPGEKRMRRLPSFSTVIREAMMMKSLQKFFMTLEPLLRKVVQEEVERGLVHGGTRLLQRPQQMHIEGGESSSFQLIFKRSLSLPIFTGSKIEDIDANPLQVIIVDTINGGSPAFLSSPIKIEIVVLDGDFPPKDGEDWSSASFQSNIVKERTGKRPLLTGDINLVLRDGTAVISDLMFTDNSSWIRSRHFRIGARVVQGSYDGPRIKEAMTEPFVVKDHRGELYRKHYPPALEDEVWRLERIGKDGAFHKKLQASGINTVQEFLKLWAVNMEQLRTILGPGMSDRMWDGTINHAKSCEKGEKLYVHRGPDCTIFLNSICEVVAITINGAPCRLEDLNRAQRICLQQLVLEAYRCWDKLEEADGLLNTSAAQIQSEPMPQGAVGPLPWYSGHQESAVLEHQLEGFNEAGSPPNVYPAPAQNPAYQWNQTYNMG